MGQTILELMEKAVPVTKAGAHLSNEAISGAAHEISELLSMPTSKGSRTHIADELDFVALAGGREGIRALGESLHTLDRRQQAAVVAIAREKQSSIRFRRSTQTVSEVLESSFMPRRPSRLSRLRHLVSH
jgi:hypothetical protein